MLLIAMSRPKCPECREERIWIFERRTISRKFDVLQLDRPEHVSDTSGPINLSPINQFEAECMRCGYSWGIRVGTIRKALEPAN